MAYAATSRPTQTKSRERGTTAPTTIVVAGFAAWAFAAAPTQLEAYRYSADGTLADLRRSDATTWTRDEFVYLQGMPVGIVHTDNLNTAPAVHWLSPDAMGTPRRVLDRSTTMTQRKRLIMDVWGRAYLYEVASTNTALSSPVAGMQNVWLPHRLPGQLQGPGEPIVENRYRYYVPTLGQYLTPDPMHQASVMVPGPQAYAYAGGRPLVMSDPLGRIPGQKFTSTEGAAFDALYYAGGLSGSNNVEYGGAVCCECDNSNIKYCPKLIVGAPNSFSDFDQRNAMARCKGDKVVAVVHSHTPNVPPSTAHNSVSPGDIANITGLGRGENGLMTGFVVFPTGAIAAYRADGYLNMYPNAVPYESAASLFRTGILQESAYVQ
jgi:RHS repeat-associated protein